MDPFLSTGTDWEKVQQILKENKELREANAALRLAAQSSPSSNNPSTKGVVAAVSNPNREKTDDGSSTAKKLKEELQRRKEEVENLTIENQRVKKEYKHLKSVFESFVVDVCERQEAYKVVFARAADEIEKYRKECEDLQRQLEERSSTTTLPAVVQQASKAALTPAVAGMDLHSVHNLLGQIRTSLSELECHLDYRGDCDQQSATLVSNKVIESQHGVVTDSHGMGQQQDTQQPSRAAGRPGQTDQDYVPQQVVERAEAAPGPSRRPVVPVQGAGALRSTLPQAAPSIVSEAKKRKRERPGKAHAVKRPATENAAQSAATLLFKGLTRKADPPKRSEVRFGSEPIADYLNLLKKTDLGKVDILRRELMNFCGSDVGVLADYIVEHFLRKAVLSPPVITLWNEVEQTMHLNSSVFATFTRKVVRKLVRFLGQDTTTGSEGVLNYGPQLQCLSLVLRMACVVQLRDTAGGGDVLFVAFYESTISALRSWRLCSTAAGQRLVLKMWMITARHLYGFVEDFHMVTRYHANSERLLEALTLPKFLTRYAVQAVMSHCYFVPSQSSTGSVPDDLEHWISFCDAMDWSSSELPYDRLGVAAVTILSSSTDERRRDEALLTLRLLVLHKGFGFLQSLTEQLRMSRGDVDVDAAFAELFSLAVIDLQLEDPLDEEWGRAMSFFMDYLSSSSVEQVKSAEEMLASCKEAHLLVLRAVLQLCGGAGALAEERVGQALNALRWVKALYVVLSRPARDVTSAPSHLISLVKANPFHRTLLGNELLNLCKQDF
uniref:Uncharacterized protein TCIL3000_11_10440 n=1 Tax=Trypanosoma congolense (strain IL3000) TaxID=1068625 RepID=G0V1Q1_TRYCI|nr:unnamed protein product [Trypanosoma congolense IL3000]